MKLSYRLSVSLDVSIDLSELLLQALTALFRNGKLRPVGSVMPSHNINSRVQRREGWLARDVVKPAVVRDEVRHLILDRLGDVLVVRSVPVHKRCIPSTEKYKKAT